MLDKDNLAGYARLLLQHPIKSVARISDTISSFGERTAMIDTFIKQEYYWLVRQLRPDTTMIDIGAGIGDTGIYFAQFEKVKRVISYEPMSKLYGTARMNIARSPLRRKIALINAAVDDFGQKRIDREYGSNISAYGKARNAQGGKLVKSVPLHEALKGLKNVAIKCDCECDEYAIFNEGVNLANVYAIEIEYHDRPERLVNLFRKKGLRLDYIAESSSKQSGLIEVRSAKL